MHYGNGSNYGTRIGIGVGIAVAVAVVILLVGFTMRRRRARAFKTAYPLQSYPNQQTGGLPFAQQPHQAGAWNGYGQGGYGQATPAQQESGYTAPPQYSGYRADSTSRYEPNTNNGSNMQYAPPSSPPPAASQSTSQPYYAPPPGPPPSSGAK
ncbi:uncharacterized protein JCM15063_004490 [Sporobolomyces koalae]|uniref:uncharacterized protein n=1 Tax=Sporobolomyces koalae TaxID=500713 RepID=UPI00316C80AB